MYFFFLKRNLQKLYTKKRWSGVLFFGRARGGNMMVFCAPASWTRVMMMLLMFWGTVRVTPPSVLLFFVMHLRMGHRRSWRAYLGHHSSNWVHLGNRRKIVGRPGCTEPPKTTTKIIFMLRNGICGD